MSPRVSCRRWMLLIALLLLAGARPVPAEEEPIYTWMDEQGQLHFTATPPPPGARPVSAKAKGGASMQVLPIPQQQGKSLARSPKVRARTHPPETLDLETDGAPVPAEPEEADDCKPHDVLTQRWAKAQREVAELTASIAALKNSIVARTESECSYDSDGRCRSGYFDRDHAIESARRKLEQAERKLSDAEDDARAAGVPPGCLVEPE